MSFLFTIWKRTTGTYSNSISLGKEGWSTSGSKLNLWVFLFLLSTAVSHIISISKNAWKTRSKIKGWKNQTTILHLNRVIPKSHLAVTISRNKQEATCKIILKGGTDSNLINVSALSLFSASLKRICNNSK